jgi:hypothetical protein
MVSDSFDPIALFKLIEKFVLKQLDNQFKTAVLVAKQLSILQFCLDNQGSNATYYDHFTTRVEVACQAGECYYTPDLLTIKAMELSLADFDMLTQPGQKSIIKLVKQDYLAYLFLHNNNAKMHSQLKKDVANDYLKGNSKVYPAIIDKALTLMNEYKPLKLDAVAVPAQGTAFVTKSYGKKAMGDDGNNNKSVISAKSVKSIKTITKTMKLLERDNCRLKKSVSALQKCDEGEDMTHPYHLRRVPAISKRQWRCCKNLTQGLYWL